MSAHMRVYNTIYFLSIFGMVGRGWRMVQVGVGMDYLSFSFASVLCTFTFM